MKTAARLILYLLILAVAAGAIFNYGWRPLGAGLPPSMQANFQAHSFGIYLHVFAAVTALLIGPLQFWAKLRLLRPRLHRWLGRIYLGFGVLCGGLAGLYMSQFANGGLVVRLGFGTLALVWLWTGFQAYWSIRAGAVEAHRAWMVRNFALTLAAVSLRVYLPLSMMAGIEFGTAYAFIAWLCWVPNLLLAELLWNRRRAQAVPRQAPAALHRAPLPSPANKVRVRS
jgi:uncharacterized membrane protein